MLRFVPSWPLLAALLLIVLSGCASAPRPSIPTPTQPPRESVVALPTVLAEPQRWSGQSLVLVAPVQPGEERRVLTLDRADTSGSQSQSAIWLAQPLPDPILSQLGLDGGVVRLRGTLSPPGAYGRDQQFTYQFSVEQADLLQPERTTLANLAENPRALDRVLLRLEGTLLVQREAALLVDRVSAGGVPLASGRQIKLPRAALDDQTVAALNRSGEVRWGAVEVIGWWQDGALTPFVIHAGSAASPATS